MCLADFAVEYDVCYNAIGSQNADRAHDNDEDDVQPADKPPAEKQYNSIISLQNDMGMMRHRKMRAILISHKFSQQNKPKRIYHSELTLFTAWRDEERDLLSNFETYSASHESHKEEITTVKGGFYRQPEALTEAINEFFKDGPPHSVWDKLASHQRQENVECAEERPEVKDKLTVLTTQCCRQRSLTKLLLLHQCPLRSRNVYL